MLRVCLVIVRSCPSLFRLTLSVLLKQDAASCAGCLLSVNTCDWGGRWWWTWGVCGHYWEQDWWVQFVFSQCVTLKINIGFVLWRKINMYCVKMFFLNLSIHRVANGHPSVSCAWQMSSWCWEVTKSCLCPRREPALEFGQHHSAARLGCLLHWSWRCREQAFPLEVQSTPGRPPQVLSWRLDKFWYQLFFRWASCEMGWLFLFSDNRISFSRDNCIMWPLNVLMVTFLRIPVWISETEGHTFFHSFTQYCTKLIVP